MTTGKERLRQAVDAAHEAVQDAHARLYEVQLAAERAENDALAPGAGVHPVVPEHYQVMRTQISELRPLLVPIVRWLQAARKHAGMTPAEAQAHNEEVLRRAD